MKMVIPNVCIRILYLIKNQNQTHSSDFKYSKMAHNDRGSYNYYKERFNNELEVFL